VLFLKTVCRLTIRTSTVFNAAATKELTALLSLYRDLKPPVLQTDRTQLRPSVPTGCLYLQATSRADGNSLVNFRRFIQNAPVDDT
jgi:hypothetical protein